MVRKFNHRLGGQPRKPVTVLMDENLWIYYHRYTHPITHEQKRIRVVIGYCRVPIKNPMVVPITKDQALEQAIKCRAELEEDYPNRFSSPEKFDVGFDLDCWNRRKLRQCQVLLQNVSQWLKNQNVCA